VKGQIPRQIRLLVAAFEDSHPQTPDLSNDGTAAFRDRRGHLEIAVVSLVQELGLVLFSRTYRSTFLFFLSRFI